MVRYRQFIEVEIPREKINSKFSVLAGPTGFVFGIVRYTAPAMKLRGLSRIDVLTVLNYSCSCGHEYLTRKEIKPAYIASFLTQLLELKHLIRGFVCLHFLIHRCMDA